MPSPKAYDGNIPPRVNGIRVGYRTEDTYNPRTGATVVNYEPMSVDRNDPNYSSYPKGFDSTQSDADPYIGRNEPKHKANITDEDRMTAEGYNRDGGGGAGLPAIIVVTLLVLLAAAFYFTFIYQ